MLAGGLRRLARGPGGALGCVAAAWIPPGGTGRADAATSRQTGRFNPLSRSRRPRGRGGSAGSRGACTPRLWQVHVQRPQRLRRPEASCLGTRQASKLLRSCSGVCRSGLSLRTDGPGRQMGRCPQAGRSGHKAQGSCRALDQHVEARVSGQREGELARPHAVAP